MYSAHKIENRNKFPKGHLKGRFVPRAHVYKGFNVT